MRALHDRARQHIDSAKNQTKASAMGVPYYRKRRSASYLVRELRSVRERERERERYRESETEVTSPF